MTTEETKDVMKAIILEGMNWEGFTDLDSTIDELYSKVVSKSASLPPVINRLSPYLNRIVSLSYNRSLTSEDQDELRHCTNMIHIESQR